VNAELAAAEARTGAVLTEIAEDEAGGAHGFDRVEFHVQTNPGTRPGPMMKVASGGELSRFMLALKVALADRGSAPTLVFDEIDTGVGGAVADAIGQRLARLAAKVQVVSVTHAPQVAARAGQHLLIAKEAVEGGARVATRVSPLESAAAARGDCAHALGRGHHRRGAGGGGTVAGRGVSMAKTTDSGCRTDAA
jgi:DNA repair protein RecN (Recombination protein N)